MTTGDKAIKADHALRQLRDEMAQKGQSAAARGAIGDFLANATDESKARLYDIVMGAK